MSLQFLLGILRLWQLCIEMCFEMFRRVLSIWLQVQLLTPYPHKKGQSLNVKKESSTDTENLKLCTTCLIIQRTVFYIVESLGIKSWFIDKFCFYFCSSIFAWDLAVVFFILDVVLDVLCNVQEGIVNFLAGTYF